MIYKRYITIAWLLICYTLSFAQQKFFNLTAEEVRIDSVLPEFTHSFPLGTAYADSTYSVRLDYAEYIDMSARDIERLQRITSTVPPSSPIVNSSIVVDRKKGRLEISFIPIVYRKGKYQKLVSFMLDVKASARKKSINLMYANTRATNPEARYASHSKLATGSWAKIRVADTGIYQLTSDLIRKAGFTDLTKVHVFGYGGALQPERLDGDYLAATDDLKEVPLCLVNGKRLFFAQGPITWDNGVRTRNPYSDYGYYFITQTDDEVLLTDSASFLATYFPSKIGKATLHEIDNYAWFEGGCNLFEDTPISENTSKTYIINRPLAQEPTKNITVALTAGTTSVASVLINDSVVGTLSMTIGEYEYGAEAIGTYELTTNNNLESYSVTIRADKGGPLRLDYITAYSDALDNEKPDLTGSFDAPEYVYNITTQDLHADSNYQMVIIIPASQQLLQQAERIKVFHETHDSIRVRIVPADEIFNEFSSGTPDANAYRRYLKMLYDRAGDNTSEMPQYLLLFGDCAWDNRMNSSAWKNYSPDDFLLCYESDNSFSRVRCYVNDGFFCSLDDGEGDSPMTSDKLDIAVGRFPVRSADEAKILVDKTISYAQNENAGAWQNIVVFLGDDGNENRHMSDANDAASLVEQLNSGMLVKRVMWDAYTRVSTSTGNTYPEATSLIKQYQQSGALIFDYSGHGAANSLSSERVLKLTDFESFTNSNLPLWITASCDIMPFDGQTDNIGETALLNQNGGAVAFFGTTRTVYVDRNKAINLAFLRALFTPQNGKFISIGEAQRIAKNSLITSGQDQTENKLQYSLLGDPALVLNIPTQQIMVDSINGISTADSTAIQLRAGQVATVKGHILNHSQENTSFNGVITAVVRDTKENVVCKLNDTSTDGASTAFQYTDRTKTLYNGQDSVKAGNFAFKFAIPKDISYSNESGLINMYAVDGQTKEAANGSNDCFTIGNSDIADNDTIGPYIYCYLNTPQFVNGDKVNTTPYFVAEISDDSGLNTTGNGIGHDLELIIDGEMSMTYNLNDYFEYDFGSYTSGITSYNLPELSEGLHKLKFRAWDILNNSSTAELSFNVETGLQPNIFSVGVTDNPAHESTTFIINHDRNGSPMDVDVELYDMSGRQIWKHSANGITTESAYTLDWDLTLSNGQPLQTGVYIYRVRISNEGSTSTSKAQKLIIITR